MSDARRFDQLERVVRDTRRQLDDLTSTILARLGTHTHPGGGGGGVTDHGALTGLADDDHPQYVTHTEGNAAYQPLDSDLTTIAGLAPSDGQVLRRAAGAWAADTLDAADVGAATSGHTHAAPDHGALSGLGDDDHTHYLTTGRHDLTARHPTSVLHADVVISDDIQRAHVAAQETTTSTSYTDLTTSGPAVSVTSDTTRTLLVFMKCRLDNTGTTGNVYMSFAASGATTQAASDADCVEQAGSGNQDSYCSVGAMTVNSGTTTITAKYRVESGTGRFQYRELLVILR